MARRIRRNKKPLKRMDNDVRGLLRLAANKSEEELGLTSNSNIKAHAPEVDVSYYGTEVTLHSVRDKLDSHLIAASRLLHGPDWFKQKVTSKLARLGKGPQELFTRLYDATEPPRTARKATEHYHRSSIAERYADAAVDRDVWRLARALRPYGLEGEEDVHQAWRDAIKSGDDMASITFALEIVQRMFPDEVQEASPPPPPPPPPPGGGGDGPDPGPGRGRKPGKPPKRNRQGNNPTPVQSVTEETQEADSRGGASTATNLLRPEERFGIIKEVMESIGWKPATKDSDFTLPQSPSGLETVEAARRKSLQGDEIARHSYFLEPCIAQQRGVLDKRISSALSERDGIHGRQLKRRGRPTSKVWRLGTLGDTKVFADRPRTTGELVVMVDFSSSMGDWVNPGSTRDQFLEPQRGYLATQMMLAIAAQHPDVQCYGFSTTSVRQTDMMRHSAMANSFRDPSDSDPSDAPRVPMADTQVVHITAGNVPDPYEAELGGGTPMCAALNALEELLTVKHAGSAAVFITDGEAGGSGYYADAYKEGEERYPVSYCEGDKHTAQIADKLHAGGTRFAVINVGFSGQGLFPADVTQVINNAKDLHRVREVLDWLDSVH
jgi:hypothetical protein